jgi:uncharacterized protein with HEPN domain
LSDIAENIDARFTFVREMTLEGFRADRKTSYAVVRALEIISEASRKLPPELLESHSAIDWPAIAAAGNVFRHEYEVVDPAQIWRAVQTDLPALHAVVEAELNRWR